MPTADTILFGSDATPGIVSVETGPESVRLYRRVDGAMVTEDREFRRWMLTTEKHPLDGAEWTELEGIGYRWLAEFRTRGAYEDARNWIRDAHVDVVAYPSPVRQYLTRSGQTMFKGMAFDDPLRMQLDIETLGLDPKVRHNEIFMVAISDNRGFETTIEGDEKSILRGVVETVRERDPDIIEGHNVLGFDFPYLAERAKQRGVKLALGRDGSEILFGARLNCMIGYFSRPYIPVHILGRHVIDTLFSVQRFDVARAELSSHGLKAVAEALGIAEENREIIPHNRIAYEWKHNPARVRTYSLQDVRETRSLAALVCPPEFFLTQMIPESYDRAATSGTGEKINYLFTREYLRQGHAIPKPSHSQSVPGGYTELRATGLIRPIVKCDVESLYPSLMLTRHIKPKHDILNVFLPALEELTRRRFDAKRKAKEAAGQSGSRRRVSGYECSEAERISRNTAGYELTAARAHADAQAGFAEDVRAGFAIPPEKESLREHAYWEGRQSSFKILINSFYGYLGGSSFNFNDYTAAAEVTTGGQAIVKKIVEELERTGSKVVEVDTDGVYFQPPDEIATEEAEVEYIDSIGESLPEGIHLAHDGRYRAMISLKMKNYVLEKYTGEKIFRGSSLRSRAEEPFLLRFLSGMTDCLLRGEPEQAVELYQSLACKIDAGEMSIEDITRRERVTEKTFTSTGRKRLAKAVQRQRPELVEGSAQAKVGDYVTIYQRKDGSIGLAEEYEDDEDRDYLLQKLYKFAGRLREAFGDDFDRMFPDPHKTRGGQQTLELF